jgi:hypothetical protein
MAINNRYFFLLVTDFVGSCECLAMPLNHQFTRIYLSWISVEYFQQRYFKIHPIYQTIHNRLKKSIFTFNDLWTLFNEWLPLRLKAQDCLQLAHKFVKSLLGLLVISYRTRTPHVLTTFNCLGIPFSDSKL